MDCTKLCFLRVFHNPLTNRNRGGLGHFAVFFAKALGAEVYVLSHTPDKEADAKKMGADHFINVKEKDWHKPYNVGRPILFPRQSYKRCLFQKMRLICAVVCLRLHP